MSETKTKSGFLLNLIKNLVFLLVAATATFGIFMLERHYVLSQVVVEQKFTTFDYAKENVVPERGIVRFADSAVYAQAQPLMDIVKSDLVKKEYVFKFGSGKFWGDFQASDAKVNFLVGDKVVLIPDGAEFDVEFDGNSLNVTVYNGDVYLGFLETGVAYSSYVDPYGTIFMNRMIVPRGSQVTIPLSRVDQKLKELLYSRLVNEFRYTGISQAERDADWVKKNQILDRDYIEGLRQDFVSDVRDGGLSSSEGAISDFIYWAEEGLSFVPEKKQEKMIERLFNFLNDSVYYSSVGDTVKAQDYLTKFNDYFGLIQPYVGQDQKYYDEVDSYIEKLSIFTPNDPQYLVYKYLLDKKFAAKRGVYDVVDKLWMDVYKGMDLNSVAAKAALDTYFNYLDKTIGKNADIKAVNPDFYKYYLAYQNQLFENLFLRYSIFYQDAYFAVKNMLEQEYLSLFDQGQLKSELSSDLISRKLDFLRRLIKYFFDEDMEVNRAKDIVARLVEEINDLMPAQGAQVAVVSLFETQLKNLGDFWGYLNSAEYNSTKTYGLTHKDRYAVYLQDRDKIWSFVNVTEDVLGKNDETKQFTVDDVKAEVQAVFDKTQMVTNLEMDPLTDVNQRFVKVRFVMGGYVVGATYDRDGETVKEVKVMDTVISDEPVKLDSLMQMIADKFSDQQGKVQAPIAGSDINKDIETNAQRIARIYISNKIQAAGFTISENQVKLVDEAKVIYRVENIMVKSSPDIVVTFDYMATKEKVANLYFKLKDQPIVMDGEYTIAEVHDLIVNNQVESKGQPKKMSRGLK